MSDTYPAPLSDQRGQRQRVKFDPTINLGHILTFAGAMLAGFGLYGNIDKRLTVTEMQSVSTVERSVEQDRRMRESVNEIKTDVKDLQRSVNELIRTQVVGGHKN